MCFDKVLVTNVGGMTIGLHTRLAASHEAMETLCAGMALQRLCTAMAKNKRAVQDLACAHKEME